MFDNDLYIRNRKKFVEQMEDGALAIFNSNDIFPISADSTMPFQQHRDILALSGVDQEESILVIFPDSFNEKHREILFLRETNEHIAVWEGEKLTKENAFKTSGIKTVYWLSDFNSILKQIMAEAKKVYINTNEHTRANTEVETREDRFIKKLQIDYPAHQYMKSAPIMHKIRSIKGNEEIYFLLSYLRLGNSLIFFVEVFIFLISSKSFLKSLTIQINKRPPKIFIK